jgi:hypothetical protein
MTGLLPELTTKDYVVADLITISEYIQELEELEFKRLQHDPC